MLEEFSFLKHIMFLNEKWNWNFGKICRFVSATQAEK